MNIHRYKQQGIGVIEVMIAAVIFALGSIAIIQLQGTYFKSSGASHSHAVAMNIAEEKLEDLRGFEAIDDSDGDIFDFVAIANNAGGQCDALNNNACALTIPSGTVTVDNTTYARSWAVTNYYYNAGTLTTTPNGNIAQKDITVTVTWTDADGSNQTATANTIINSNSVASGGVLVSNAGGSGENPVVPYTPSTDDSVTAITVGTNSKRETLVPTTTTVDGYSRSTFTAYTYNSNNILTREEEFETVACTCKFDGTSATGSETYAASYPKWDATAGTYKDTTGELVAGKVKGCVKGGGNNCSSNPDPQCEVCCRDHHDKTGVTALYDPYRSSNDFETSGNHKHYNGTNTPVTSGQYIESCRMKRIDGFWRVFQDWHLVNFEALPLTDLGVSTVKASYATYVNSIIDAHLDQNKVNGQALSSPPSQPSAIDHTTSGSSVSLAVGAKAALSGRAVYLDYMFPDHLSAVKASKTAGDDYLLNIPFYEVELAGSTTWSSENDNIVRVGPDNQPGNSNDLINGEMQADQTDTSAITITANLRKSNSGITALNYPVDYNATTNPDSEERTDTIEVCVGCTTTTASCTTPWGATLAHGATAIGSNSTQYAVSPATCPADDPLTCNNGTLSNANQYASCTVVAGLPCTTPWGQDIAHGSSYPTSNSVGSVVSPATCPADVPISCSNGTLSNTNAYETCTVLAGAGCTTPWGLSMASGDTVDSYSVATVNSPDSCPAKQDLTCTNGTLSNNNAFGSCQVITPTCTGSVKGKVVSNGDVVSVTSSNGETGVCSQNGKNYTCSITTTTTASLTVATTGGQADKVTTINCGATINLGNF